ncbi:MAG: nitrogenase stabilizing/protective protein NifW [Acidobacteriaceae bacterium]
MTMLEQMSKLSSAEEFFQFLEVAYDPAVLNVARLHILRRMGEYLHNSPIEVDEKAARAHFRAHLKQAYEDFAHSSPLNERVFKVHKDAIRTKSMSLVSLLIPGMDTGAQPR